METANTPQDYLNFLLKVLQKISENPNPQLIYPFLAQNLDKLDENLIQVLDDWARQTLTQVTPQQANSIATDIFYFSNFIARFPLRSIAVNKEIAINGYKIVLDVVNFETSPIKWATTLHNVGNVYLDRIKGNKAENLEKAIIAYQKALNVYTFDNFPQEWAETQFCIAFAYSDRIKGDRAENLEKAISAYQESLKVYTFEAFSEKWATMQYNLAGAYTDRIKEDKAENLEKAISAYHEALKVRTDKNFPEKWAATLYNLANAYRIRIKGDKAENLENAIVAYQEALKVYTIDAFPENWAAVKNNLALAYRERIRGNKAKDLEKAITAYQETLKVYTVDTFPENWAAANNNLALAYRARISGDKADNLEMAITNYQEALKVRTFDAFPKEWASTQHNLASAYIDRIRENKAENLQKAITACTEALKVRTFDNFPQDWARTQNTLGNAYRDRLKGDKAENLEQAIISYQESLKVITFDAFPQEWAGTEHNLANAYLHRIRGNKAENLEMAIIACNEALKVRTFDTFPYDWAMTQNLLANAYSERNRGDKTENLEQAIFCYQESLKVRTFDAFPYEWASTQNNLGNAYCHRIRGDKAENLEQAIMYYQNALKVYTLDAFPYEWARIQNNLGNAYSHRIRGSKAANLDTAINYYNDALKIRTQKADPLNCLETARNLANLHYNEKQWQSATEAYHLAIEALENARSEALNPQSRQEVLSNAIDVFHSIVQAHLHLNQPDKALEYIERSKARNLVELMTQKNVKPKNVDQATIDQYDELRQRVVTEQISLQNQSINQNISRIDNLMPYVIDQSHLKEYQQELDDFIDQKITPFDSTFKLTQKVEPIPFKDIQALIDPETCLLQWYITSEKILAFVVSADGNIQYWQSSETDLQTFIDTLNNYLQLYYSEKCKWIKQLSNLLQTLAETLHIDDILALIPNTCKRLIIVPHCYLHILPIHCLCLKNGNFLYESFPKGVGYAPSCQLLKLVQSSQKQNFNRLFVIKNPTRKPPKSLLGANLETKKISQYFDPNKTIIIAESEASEMTLQNRRKELQSSHCIHFSCHGKFNHDSPLDSALLLADPEGDLGESANLTLAEVFEKLDLRECRLVTFSACESGIIDPNIISDEYVGLPSGFLFAGSSSVVSTLWTVDPLATALFMTKFYRNLHRMPTLNEGSIAITLNKTQTWLKNFSSQKLARIKNSEKFQQLLLEIFADNERDYKKFKELLEATVKRDSYPFAKPYYWTAFIATGI